MESSKCGHAIAKRSNPNDVFLTPIPLVKQQIAMIQTFKSDVWLDPFFGTGNYYNNFPTDKKDFCEIADPYNKDFFTYKVGEFSSRPDAIFFERPDWDRVDVICSNPPYSMINEILDKCVRLNPRVISLLIGQGNLTTKRIAFMNENGYGLHKVLMSKVFEWYGFSYICQWEKNKDNVIMIDRTIYHDENHKNHKKKSETTKTQE